MDPQAKVAQNHLNYISVLKCLRSDYLFLTMNLLFVKTAHTLVSILLCFSYDLFALLSASLLICFSQQQHHLMTCKMIEYEDVLYYIHDLPYISFQEEQNVKRKTCISIIFTYTVTFWW